MWHNNEIGQLRTGFSQVLTLLALKVIFMLTYGTWYIVHMPHCGLWVVVCWFSPLLQGFFSGFSSFTPCTKNNISKFQWDSVDEEPLPGNATVNCLLCILACSLACLTDFFSEGFFLVTFLLQICGDMIFGFGQVRGWIGMI
jgi:hypothetical protein